MPRSRKLPPGAKRPAKDGAARQHRPTSELHEDPPPYRADASPSPGGEGRGEGERSGKQLRFIDLFCGIGGFRIAFERAGARCIFSSDWDKFSRQTYAANFGEEPHGDIHSVVVADIPKFDNLCGGFPCQLFSLAGVSKKNSLGRQHGFADVKQGNLFFSIADILDHHQPPAIVLENLKHLHRHDGGRTFQIIHDTLTNALGYPDKNDKPDRLNFGGVHRAGERQASTGLTMRLTGYDSARASRPIPKGLRLPAQGCEKRATLGMVGKFSLNPNGVASMDQARMLQPRWGWNVLGGRTQGSSCLATLGLVTESLWDSRKFVQDSWTLSGLLAHTLRWATVAQAYAGGVCAVHAAHGAALAVCLRRARPAGAADGWIAFAQGAGGRRGGLRPRHQSACARPPASSAKPAAKKRSQFRVASKNIAALYEKVEVVEV